MTVSVSWCGAGACFANTHNIRDMHENDYYEKAIIPVPANHAWPSLFTPLNKQSRFRLAETSYAGCQINGTGGNNINNTAFLQVPGSFPGGGQVTYARLGVRQLYYRIITLTTLMGSPRPVGTIPLSTPPNVVWNPGEGMIIENSSASSGSFTLNGTTPTFPSFLRPITVDAANGLF